MGGFIKPLAVGKVIGDVIDPFVLAAKIGVHFGSKQVANSCKIKPSLVADGPHVRVLAASNNPTNRYTLDRCGYPMGFWCHSRANIAGKEVVSYVGPNPRTGIHRCAFVAFKQTGGSLVGVEANLAEHRANFNTRQSASKHALGLPVAVVYFNSQKDVKTATR